MKDCIHAIDGWWSLFLLQKQGFINQHSPELDLLFIKVAQYKNLMY